MGSARGDAYRSASRRSRPPRHFAVGAQRAPILARRREAGLLQESGVRSVTLWDWRLHLACLGLVACDLGAHAWRLRILVRGLGEELSFADAFVLNAFGDAAS